MRQALHQLGDRHDGDKLAGPHADGDAHHDEDEVTQHVIQQMVSVVRPHRHLALAVVQRVQLPPPSPAMLGAMDEVVHEGEPQQVQHEADQRHVGDTGPQ